MPYVWSILWGVSVPTVMIATVKWWLPQLNHAEDPAEQDNRKESCVPGRYTPRTPFFQKTPLGFAALAAVCCFCMACGYVAAEGAVSVWSILRMWVGFGMLACITVTDAELMIIPNKCSLALLLFCTALYGCQWIADGAFPGTGLAESLICGVICLVMLLVISMFTKGGLGMGDVKIMSSLGFLCGLRTVCYVMTVALFVCALCSSALLLTKKKQLKDLLPLGPFLWIAMGVLILIRFI